MTQETQTGYLRTLSGKRVVVLGGTSGIVRPLTWPQARAQPLCLLQASASMWIVPLRAFPKGQRATRLI